LDTRGDRDDTEGAEITIPMPDGTFARFKIQESQILAPELAAKFPEIKTFRGQGIDDRTATVQIDSSPSGFHTQVLFAGSAVVVDPFDQQEQVYATYERTHVLDQSRFDCDVSRGAPPVLEVAAQRPPAAGGARRVYRLAVAATGEYTAEHGGTVASAMSGITTTVTRVSGIYERELSIQLMLIANNDKLIFTDACNDPFTNDQALALVEESQREIDRIIGDAGYDIGHTFSTGAGGRAELESACHAGRKARGVTGRSSPFGDAFDVDYVAHEIGHQFGGDHTFNGALKNCGNQRNASTAFEPGSGSTIQAYAGICEGDNLQDNTHPYFHSISLEQILRYTGSDNGDCGTPTPTGNRPPVANAGPDRVIPKETPFFLTATASDPDGDALTYCWEERDLGPQARLTAADDGKLPLFRSREPTTDASRTFPQLIDLLSGNASLGEQKPSRSRSMTFRVTVRDNQAIGGAVSSDDVVVRVHAGAGPFKVTAPGAGTLRPGPITVTWNVAGTDRSPVSAGFVNILLSTDGGLSFKAPLATNTPNDGSEIVDIPDISSPINRIKVEASGNVFFSLSPDFRIER